MERKKFRDDHKPFNDNQLEGRNAVLEVLKNVVICILFQKKMRKSALDMGMFCKKTAQ